MLLVDTARNKHAHTPSPVSHFAVVNYRLTNCRVLHHLHRNSTIALHSDIESYSGQYIRHATHSISLYDRARPRLTPLSHDYNNTKLTWV